ncbi:MAG: AsmA family protein [Thermodesulfobacteriota bacterium]|nr:AsmA family protein [Thermodesulfobacteriota bacterium]
MKKLSKILVTFFVLIGVVLVGLSLFVHFYLTEDRVKALVIPRAEKALGRTVLIGGIDVGLFSGITVKDFTVKETDGHTDFVSIKEFVLRYDLLPLLQQKIVVSKVRLDAPYVRVLRDKDGVFNFETLAVLAEAEPGKQKPEDTGKPASAALPLALTVNKVTVDNAQFVVRDALKEIPDTDVKADIKVSLDLGRDPASLRYRGDLRFEANAEYGELRPHVFGKGDFDQDRLGYIVDVSLEKEQVSLSGEVKNYAKVPDIQLDVVSDTINIDHLLALAAGLPAASQKVEKGPSKDMKTISPAAPGTALPPGLKAAGEIKIGQALYKGLAVKDFLLEYGLDKGVLTVKDLSTKVADGQVHSKIKADFNKPGLVYDGQLDMESVNVEGLLASLAPKAKDMISCALQSHLTFSGAGIEWPKLQNALIVDGTYGLHDGRVSNTPVTVAVAKLLGLDELNNLSFEDIDGSLHIIKGQVALKTRMSSKDVNAQAKGTVGLDGKLDLPVTLHFSPELSEKLKKRVSMAKYLVDETGEAEIRLKLVGTVTRPYPTLDTAGMQEQVKKTVRKKAIEELRKAILGKKKAKDGNKDAKPDAANELIKGQPE